MLNRCAQDTCIPREIALGECGHHAAAARTGDAQANGIADREDLSDPAILHEGLLTVRSLYNDIWAKPPDLEAPRWIQLPQPIECSRGQQMHDGTVEKSPLRQTEVGDGVPVLEAFDICPVVFRCGYPQIGQCGFTDFL